MKDLPEKEFVNTILDRVCTHRSFEKSPRNIRLLRFLVQQALEKKDVKEHIIGMELFEQTYDPEKNDGKVRVYMFNLRKKLDEYYAGDGQSDELFFEIKKGQYNLSFIRQKETEEERENSPSLKNELWRSKRNIVVVLSTLVVAACLTFVFFPKKNYYVWNSFFEDGKQNICVVSDHFVVEEQNQWGEWEGKHVNDINNEMDLIKFAQENEKRRLRASDYTLFTKMAPLTVYQTTKWFMQHNSDYVIRLESEFRYEDSRNNNILYIGQFKTMNYSRMLFLRDSKMFKVLADGFVLDKDGIKTTHTTHITKEKKKFEYTMVSFMPLENGNEALFFSSNHDIGVMATVRNFMNHDWLETFYKENLPKNKKYFNALFEVTGMHRTDVGCELIAVETF